MKRINHIYEKIINIDNIKEAHKCAKKGKSHYSQVKMVNENESFYLNKIQQMLENKTYNTSPYDIFTVNDNGKEREIYKLPYFPDRIVHWAIMLQLEDVFMKTFIHDTYAAIPGRGPHKALKKLHHFMEDREGTQYCLKLDVKKFFPSINQSILKSLLKKKIKDKYLLWLLDEIIVSCETGLPIGNYLSQFLSNFYLTYFDHWLKEEKKVKYLIRYMDDIVILHHDKEFLHRLRKDIDMYLEKELHLSIKENWQVFPTYKRGVDFVGYRSFGDYTLLRKRTAAKVKRNMKDLSKKDILTQSEYSRLMSHKGWVQHCDNHNLQKKYITPLLRKEVVK
jgi:RNA-directed DNA polymerase